MQTNSSSMMPIDKARATIWPFRDLRGQPIGNLLDNGLITLKDLGFAVERAYDKRVRDASKTLLLQALEHTQNEPESIVGPLNVLSSERRSFAERRQIQWAMVSGVVPGLVLGACISFLFQLLLFRGTSPPENQRTFTSLLQSPSQLLTFGVIIAILIGLVRLIFWFMDWIDNRIEKQIQLYRIGQQGEERVINALYHALDGNWWLFRNLEIPGYRNGDIDLVLVGPIGVWVLEVKAYSGEYRVAGNQWQRGLGNQWVKAFSNPSTQSKRNASTLAQVFGQHNIKQWVNPVVVWANPDTKLIIENSDVKIWHLFQVGYELEKIKNDRAISEEQKAQMIDVIKGFYQQAHSTEN